MKQNMDESPCVAARMGYDGKGKAAEMTRQAWAAKITRKDVRFTARDEVALLPRQRRPLVRQSSHAQHLEKVRELELILPTGTSHKAW